MKLFLALVVVVVVCWFGLTHWISFNSHEATVAVASSSPKPTPTNTAAPAVAPQFAVAPAPSVSAAPATKPVAAITSAEAPQIVLENVLGPNGLYHDDLVGLSATFPEGWQVRRAFRWGTNNHENTVFLQPNLETTAVPSMYYKQYVDPPPDPSTAEAYLRNQAQQKEDARIAGGRSDYKNVPESFAYFDINGSPALSYFATFNQGDQVMTEYFIRVLEPKGYVMFFTTGRLEDVKAIMSHVKQMAASLKGP